MMKKRFLLLAMIVAASISLSACTTPVEKETEVPETPTAEDMVENEEEDPSVGLNEEVLELSMEYEEQAIDLATYALNSMITKNENYDNTDRRDAFKEITHPDYVDWMEYIHSVYDEAEISVLSDVELLDVDIREAFPIGEDGAHENVFLVFFSFTETVDGEPTEDRKSIGLALYEKSLKVVSFYDVKE